MEAIVEKRTGVREPLCYVIWVLTKVVNTGSWDNAIKEFLMA